MSGISSAIDSFLLFLFLVVFVPRGVLCVSKSLKTCRTCVISEMAVASFFSNAAFFLSPCHRRRAYGGQPGPRGKLKNHALPLRGVKCHDEIVLLPVSLYRFVVVASITYAGTRTAKRGPGNHALSSINLPPRTPASIDCARQPRA